MLLNTISELINLLWTVWIRYRDCLLFCQRTNCHSTDKKWNKMLLHLLILLGGHEENEIVVILWRKYKNAYNSKVNQIYSFNGVPNASEQRFPATTSGTRLGD